MSKPKHQCVYIKKANLLYKIFWANVTKRDGSVIIGIDNSAENILKIYDPLYGEMEANKDFKCAAGKNSNFKFTFHKSGRIKVGDTRINKLDNTASDRCTISGIPLNEIDKPQRMMEVLMPKYLSKNIIKIEDFNNSSGITIDITNFPEDKPLRCTVYCMAKYNLEKIIHSKVKFVNTSIYESFHGLEFQNLVWTFIIRTSKEDTLYPDEFKIFVPGKMKWPS